MLWTDACRLVPFFTGPAGEVARPQSLKPRRRPTITHQPGRVQQARSRWPRRPAADARPGAPQPAADGRCHTARQMQRSGRGSSWSGRPAADPSPPALGWSACTRRRLVASILARVCASGRRPAVVLQLSDSQHVVVRERDERRNGADSECGTIGRVCWTRQMVLDTESEGIILVTFLQYFCKTESYSVRQTAPGWSLSVGPATLVQAPALKYITNMLRRVLRARLFATITL